MQRFLSRNYDSNIDLSLKTGTDKRAYIAAPRQAKIYPPWQAAKAAIHRQIVDCGCHNAQAAIQEVECSSDRGLRLVHCGGAAI